MMSEKIELLGSCVYGDDIPKQLTLKAMPTSTELDYVGSEDFMQTMLESILPKCVEEKINFRKLLEIDFHWICRCLRFLNYGPYYTTNKIYCPDCGQISKGETRIDLRGVECKTLPEGFKNEIQISKDEFLDYKGDITVSLLTVADGLNASEDNMFKLNGKQNKEFARICYSIKSMGTEKNMTPVQAKLNIEKQFSSADYIILREKVSEVTDYGLRAGGSTTCPNCGSKDAAFIALVDDRFLRPTLGDLREWKANRS